MGGRWLAQWCYTTACCPDTPLLAKGSNPPSFSLNFLNVNSCGKEVILLYK